MRRYLALLRQAPGRHLREATPHTYALLNRDNQGEGTLSSISPTKEGV